MLCKAIDWCLVNCICVMLSGRKVSCYEAFTVSAMQGRQGVCGVDMCHVKRFMGGMLHGRYVSCLAAYGRHV